MISTNAYPMAMIFVLILVPPELKNERLGEGGTQTFISNILSDFFVNCKR